MQDIRGFLLLLFILPLQHQGIFQDSQDLSDLVTHLGSEMCSYSLKAQQMSINTDTVLLGNEAITGLKYQASTQLCHEKLLRT